MHSSPPIPFRMNTILSWPRILFQLAVRVQKATGVHIAYINLSGGVGIPYRPDADRERHHGHRRGRPEEV